MSNKSLNETTVAVQPSSPKSLANSMCFLRSASLTDALVFLNAASKSLIVATVSANFQAFSATSFQVITTASGSSGGQGVHCLWSMISGSFLLGPETFLKCVADRTLFVDVEKLITLNSGNSSYVTNNIGWIVVAPKVCQVSFRLSLEITIIVSVRVMKDLIENLFLTISNHNTVTSVIRCYLKQSLYLFVL